MTLLMFDSLPSHLRVYILNFFAGGTHSELEILHLVSKGFREDCRRPGIECKLFPVFQLRPFPNGRSGCAIDFFRSLCRYQQDETKRRMLQRYRVMIVEDINKFDYIPPCFSYDNDDNYDDDYAYENKLYNELDTSTENVQMDGIQLLNLSCPTWSSSLVCYNDYNALPSALSLVLPNLREINLSHTRISAWVLKEFVKNCPLLETIEWNNSNIHDDCQCLTNVLMNGNTMRSARNLKEIIMDDSKFRSDDDNNDIDNSNDERRLSDLIDHPNTFLFHECCKVLERVSIRNAEHGNGTMLASVSQDALIKFVRNAPLTLKWFRSDLTKENIDMLRLERPGIELLN